MTSSESGGMVLYLEGSIPEQEVISALEAILGVGLSSAAALDSDSRLIYWFTVYDRGFTVGVSITWGAKVSVKLDGIQVATRLSARIGKRVATDLPQGHPQSVDPYMWCVVEPTGNLFVCSQDLNEEEALVIDEQTCRPFVFGGRQ